MRNKNYMSPKEYGIWKYINHKEIINNELIGKIFPEISINQKHKILHSFFKKGYLKRIRKNLYYNPIRLKDFYKLTLEIHHGYVGLSSALRYYNLLDYEDFTIFIMTKDFQKNLPLNGTKYEVRFVPLKHLFTGFEKKDDIYISSVEKTIFDCLLKPGIIGFSNITKAIYDAEINWKKFIYFFGLSENISFRQRTGYILELMQNELKINIPHFVFEFLSEKIKTPVKLTNNKNISIFDKKWKIEDNVGKKNIL